MMAEVFSHRLMPSRWQTVQNLSPKMMSLGQYGKGLNEATWHIGDDCLVTSVKDGFTLA